jgi:hypothetical protein
MELLDDIPDTTHDYWVEMQMENFELHPGKVVDKLVRIKGVSSQNAHVIVNRVYKIVRKRTARKQLLIGTGLIISGGILAVLLWYLGLALFLFGVLKLGTAISQLIDLHKEKN